MKGVEASAEFGCDHHVIIQAPLDVTPGALRMVLVVEESTPCEFRGPPLFPSAYRVGLVDDSFRFRQKEIYEDDGR